MKKDDKFHPSDFESKWQKTWEEKGVYQPDLKKAKRPYYNLMMFPYPSAEGLHVGNMYAFTGADINGRFKRMQGYDVFEPIGLDGFGIHSENYAIKIGKHPREQAHLSEQNFYRQLRAIGNGFAWENHLETYDPEYYRFTQWIFVAMFKAGLAYRKKSLVNFCPSCKTVLSDEQVIEGKCERCKSEVGKKEMEQWFFKITKYAQRLLQNTYAKDFQWTEKVKVGQRNWIGKKEGINITYPVVAGPASRVSQTPLQHVHSVHAASREASFGSPSLASPAKFDYITCFTTRPDTNFGATFVVIGPEHPFATLLCRSSSKFLPRRQAGKVQSSKLKEIMDYRERARNTSEADRIAAGRKKTGVFTGFYAVNQLTGYKMPIYVADFVLGHVGTGAVVGVPGHDLRDFEFAREFNIPVIRVVVGKDGDASPIKKAEQVQEEEGTMINSGFLDGVEIHEAIKKMMDYLEKKGWGKRVTTYKLRDWCISRQRYWGAPIPMIFCPSCAESGKDTSGGGIRMPGWYPVPEDQLPVLLPDLKDWKPEGTGKGPLAKLSSFVKITCPECGSAARRETDVCDTFLDSSWYFLRYPSLKTQNSKLLPRRQTGKTQNQNSKLKTEILELPWNLEITKKWLPVTQYIGGAEHTVLHLLYARFVTLVFKDLGLIDFEEPFTRFYAHGLIISEGAKMSKSRGNVIIPDEYIRKYGADTLRAYLMFLGPFDQGGDFRDTGIAGMYRFLGRVWRLVTSVIPSVYPERSRREVEGSSEGSIVSKDSSTPPRSGVGRNDNLLRFMHRTIKAVTEDLENFRYNTAIAHIMEFVNEISNLKSQISNLPEEIIKTLLLLLAPFAPHMTEELWSTFNSQPASPAGGLSTLNSIHLHPWPSYDVKYLVEDKVTIIVQVNGKLRDTISVQSAEGKDQKVIEETAKKSEKVKKYLEGKPIRKTIFVPGKLLNFVV